MLSSELSDYHERTLTAYKDWVKSYSWYNSQVETPADYMQEKSVLPSTAAGVQSRELAERLVPEDAFHVFYRVSPGSDQSVMVIGENPRFQSYSEEWYTEKEGSELLSTDGAADKLAEVGKTRLMHYLLRTGGTNWTEHLDALFTHVPWLEAFEGEVDEELHQSPERFYENVYYTNAWKFATPSGISCTKGRAELAHPRIHEEVEIVDPDLLLICSGSAWRFVNGRGVDPSDDMPMVEIESLDGSPVDGPYEGTGPEQSAGGVFNMDGRIAVTTKHPGRYGASGTQEALQRAGEYL